jgi:hypothetical protein
MVPFSEWDEKRSGIEIFNNQGFDIDVWNIGMITNSKVFDKKQGNFEYRTEKRFKTISEFKISLSKNQGVFIICFLPYTYRNFWIFRLISKYKNPYCINRDFSSVSIGSTAPSTMFEKVINKIKILSMRRILEKLFLLTPIKALGIRSCDIVFAGGKKSFLKHPLIDNSSQIVYVHANDYDFFLEHRNRDKIKTNTEFAVFIDQNLAFNTDPKITGTGKVVTEKNYFPSLVNFFDQIEKINNIKVIIAAHPRANYKDRPNIYGKREIVFGKTLELVRDSKIILVHYSNAINFAILFKKPILCFTTKELDSSFRKPAVDSLASELNKKVYNIDVDRNIDLSAELVIDNNLYETYKEDYIKIKDTPELPFWNVVAQHIEGIISTSVKN